MKREFIGSAQYWDYRYQTGGDSGKGSYGELAEFKADTLNRFVSQHQVQSVVEFGCGDGHQLSLAKYPRYSGYDVSKLAVDKCRDMFRHDASKQFAHVDDYLESETAELVLSLDVIFHLVEQSVFETYMQRLFGAAERFVAIYCSNQERAITPTAPHVRHRRFSGWVDAHANEFVLLKRHENPYRHGNTTREGHTSPSDFYFYSRTAD